MRTIRAGVAACLGVLGLGLSACSTGESGEPVVKTTPGTVSASESEASPTGSPSLANTDPCSLLSVEELRDYGQRFDGPRRENTGSARECTFQKPFDVKPRGSLVISPAIRSEQGIQDAVDQGYGIQNTQSNGREFARIPSAGSCTVAIGVTEKSRVDVYVGMAEGTEKSCEVASEVADIVAPKLPEG